MKNKSLGFLELFPTRLIPVVPGSVWSPRPPARFLTVGDGIRSLFAYDAPWAVHLTDSRCSPVA